jgi:nucleoid DNA-binding protein
MQKLLRKAEIFQIVHEKIGIFNQKDAKDIIHQVLNIECFRN